MIKQTIAQLFTALNLQTIAAVAATANGTAVDLKDYEGEAKFVLDCLNTAGTLPTLDCVLEESADNSSFSAVTGGAFAQVTAVGGTNGQQVLNLNTDSLKRYVRVAKTIGGTDSPSFVTTVKAFAMKKYPA